MSDFSAYILAAALALAAMSIGHSWVAVEKERTKQAEICATATAELGATCDANGCKR